MKRYRVFYILYEKESSRIIGIYDTVFPSEGYPMIHEIKSKLKQLQPNFESAITACTEIED